jgi:hypothetical protein
MTQVALICGILSSFWYAAINVLVPMLWPAYSSVNQTVSELSAIGAPTRSVWIIVALPYVLLFAAFGWGVLQASKQNRKLLIDGWLIIFYCIFNVYWPPMHLREVLAAGGGTLSDTLHLVWASITTILFMLIMGFAAFALDKKFRIYTAISMALLPDLRATARLLDPKPPLVHWRHSTAVAAVVGADRYLLGGDGVVGTSMYDFIRVARQGNGSPDPRAGY